MVGGIAGSGLLMPAILQQTKTIVAAIEHGSLSEEQRIEKIISFIAYHKAPLMSRGFLFVWVLYLL